MDKSSVQRAIVYWTTTAEHDYETMTGLFKIKRYSDCLFFGHIVLEKILKAHVVKKTLEQPPYIHDLARLAELAKLDLPDNTISFLNQVNDFNIRARYPEEKLKFYKKCTPSFTKKYLDEIITLYKNLCQKLN